MEALDLFSRGIVERLRTAGRDLGMVGNRLILGRSPSPLIARPKPAAAPVAPIQRKAPSMARPAKVVKVVRETPNAVSIYLTEADGSAIEFKPGQFLSVDLTVNEKRLRRAYSIASPRVPGAPVHITVKRIEEGRVSNRLNDTVKEGDQLEVLGPSGSFTIEPQRTNERHLVMTAGGSGITPIMSILETVLRVEERSRVTLIYGNRDWEEVIFRDRLSELREEIGDRLTVDHVLEHPPQWWTGEQGLLSSEIIASRMQALQVEDDGHQRYFICGPTAMMDSAHRALERLGIDPDRIAEERFNSPEARSAQIGSDKAQLVLVSKTGQDQAIQVGPGQTILEAALAAGIELPFSCAMGGCGACRVHRTQGEVQMEEPNCLSGAEREHGYVLTCVGRPLSPSRIEVVDNDDQLPGRATR